MITTATPIFSAIKRERYAKEIIKVAIGIVLLLAGIALIIHGFGAPMPHGSNVSQVFNSLPDLKTFMSLMGGAAAVVIGVQLTFRNKLKRVNA